MATIGDFHTGPQKTGNPTWEEARAAMDASLEEARLAHAEYAARVEGDKYGNGVGVGVEPNITLGFAREPCSDYCVCSKLELGTWAERLSEMCIEIEKSQTFENVREKVQGIARWWDMCGEYMQNHSSPLGETALKILEEQQKEGVFPEGMTLDWSLDMQSAQTLDFLAALKANSKQEGQNAVAWDLGTLTGISAAVLGSHFDKVETVERNEHLAGSAEKCHCAFVRDQHVVGGAEGSREPGRHDFHGLGQDSIRAFVPDDHGLESPQAWRFAGGRQCPVPRFAGRDCRRWSGFAAEVQGKGGLRDDFPEDANECRGVGTLQFSGEGGCEGWLGAFSHVARARWNDGSREFVSSAPSSSELNHSASSFWRMALSW